MMESVSGIMHRNIIRQGRVRAEAIEFLMERMRRAKTNQEFLDSMAAGQ